MIIQRLVRIVLTAAMVSSAIAASAAPMAPKVAVTGLAYEERVREYFRVVAAKEKSSLQASSRVSERETAHSSSRRGHASVNARSERSYYEAEGTYSYIERGELHKFTADIKGGILKAGLFDLVQAKPFKAKDSEKLYDIIARIKQGMFPGADYVLFGSVSNIEFREEANPIDNTDTVARTLSLELVGEFSLISTRTFKVKSAFSAMGTGQDVKLITTRGGKVVLNRGKVIAEVSQSLGEDVTKKLQEQLSGIADDGGSNIELTHATKQKEEVIIFK